MNPPPGGRVVAGSSPAHGERRPAPWWGWPTAPWWSEPSRPGSGESGPVFSRGRGRRRGRAARGDDGQHHDGERRQQPLGIHLSPHSGSSRSSDRIGPPTILGGVGLTGAAPSEAGRQRAAGLAGRVEGAGTPCRSGASGGSRCSSGASASGRGPTRRSAPRPPGAAGRTAWDCHRLDGPDAPPASCWRSSSSWSGSSAMTRATIEDVQVGPGRLGRPVPGGEQPAARGHHQGQGRGLPEGSGGALGAVAGPGHVEPRVERVDQVESVGQAGQQAGGWARPTAWSSASSTTRARTPSAPGVPAPPRPGRSGGGQAVVPVGHHHRRGADGLPHGDRWSSGRRRPTARGGRRRRHRRRPGAVVRSTGAR